MTRTFSGVESRDWGGHAKGSPEYRRVLLALACAGVATFAQLYSPQGILPEISDSLRVGADQSALLISVATLGLAAAVLPWSVVADRIGRLPVMRYSLIAATVFGLAVTLCPNFTGLLVLRALEGAALGGLPAIAMTYLQEEIAPSHTAVAAGTYISGTTVGGLLGRLVAAPVTGWIDWRWGVGVVVALSASAAAAFMVLTPRPRGFVRTARADRRPLSRVLWLNLRSPAMLALYLQGFLLMGGFVTVYNYLSFRLKAPPFLLPSSLIAFLFLAYLAGTWSSRRAGAIAGTRGRLPVLLTAIVIMIVGVLITLVDSLPVIIVGLVILTVGFFGAHSIASGWSAARATVGRAQAASMYNLFYYGGSSVVGWAAGLVFTRYGWDATALVVVALAVVAGACAATALRSPRRS